MLRAWTRAHSRTAALVVALALALKALIPAGYMIASEGSFAIVPCSNVFATGADPQSATGGGHHAHHAIMDHGTMAHGHTAPGHDSHAAAQQACPYAVLSMASLGGADPVLLAAAIAFVLTLGFAPFPTPELPRPVFLRPQLRGPPLPS